MSDLKYLHELYAKDIDRPFNPAVNASDFNEKTVQVEIEEYVFTDEIINNLYNVLASIRDRKTDHNGIWINGYFGSGKSHFLKFLDYCLHPKYGEAALEKLTEAVNEHDPLQNPDSHCDVTVAEITELSNWLKSAEVETILFNIGSVANSNTNQSKVFTEVFWHEFNRRRGYNTFSLPLAQYFEKVLDEKGKFGDFKSKLEDEYGFEWDDMASDLANTELDTILEVAKEIVPTLSIDIIRDRISKNDFPLSVEAFMKELRSYIADKPDNYRLVFFADEISQFIDNRSALLLQLQQIVSDLHEACQGKVWIACTAQQDLTEIIGDCHIDKATDDYGKIMGRFQVKVSLKGTNTEYITQKRILEKKGSAAIVLEQNFERIHANITAQLLLPTGYNTYRTKEEYSAYYPFIPYQFTLMMKIFDAFVAQNFVDKEVKGNERSIIKITHSVAKNTKDQEIGDLISFDQFYNAMFRGSLTSKGQKAISTATSVIESYNTDRELGTKVVNVLFMICNMDEQERRVFPATVDYITSLLMRDVDANKKLLKERVQNVVDYLVDNNILRRDTLTDGNTEFYSFYTEEERRVAASIGNQYVDNDFMSSMLIDFFKEYLTPNNRESYYTSRLSVGGILNGKTFLNSNADVVVDFAIDTDVSLSVYALQNQLNRIVFYMSDAYRANPTLRNKLTWICKVRKFLQSPDGQTTSEARNAALNKFRQMANDEYKEIAKLLKDLFNSANVICGNHEKVIASSTKDKDRYTQAMSMHLKELYPYASIVNGDKVPKTEAELKSRILRPSDPNEYTGTAATLTEPEKEIENHLKRHGGEANLKDIIKKFSEAPYGWCQEATAYFVNELVRRNVRGFTYNNEENPERNIVASNIIRDAARFMVKPTKDIPQSVINEFISSWHDIFGEASSPASSHPADIHSWAKDTLNTIIGNNKDAASKIGGSSCPMFKHIDAINSIFAAWSAIRDDEQFFRCVAADRETAKNLMDRMKQIREFATNQTMLRAYIDFKSFVNDNVDNWQHLPEEYLADIEAIKSINTEEWPIDKMKNYKKMRETLSKALSDVRKNYCNRITEKLKKEDAQLASYAAENNIEYQSVVDSEITRETISSSISTLRANELSSDWFTREIAKLNTEIARRNASKSKHGDGGDSIPTPSHKVVRLRLNTPSLSNIKTLEDVESYLDIIRKQLTNKLANINDGDEIQIL